MENRTPGAGINGILYAAPVADAVAAVVILALTVVFFRKLPKRNAVMNQTVTER